jgi:Zn-dependent protease with chaperone function
LFIEDPDNAARDEVAVSRLGMLSTDQQLVQSILSRPVSAIDQLMELFTTHPNMVKRLQALQRLI